MSVGGTEQAEVAARSGDRLRDMRCGHYIEPVRGYSSRLPLKVSFLINT